LLLLIGGGESVFATSNCIRWIRSCFIRWG